jgi:hypothetical protein
VIETRDPRSTAITMLINIALGLLSMLTSASAAKTLSADVISIDELKGGTRVTINAGSEDGVEFGDIGMLKDGKRVVTKFNIDHVDKRSSRGFVPITRPESNRYMAAQVVLSPGTTPPTLGKKDIGAGPLGSCDTDYTMHKSGEIQTWISVPNSTTVALIVLKNVGWKHRVCADSTGMIYQGGVGDAFVTDKAGKKIRLRITTIGWNQSIAEVLQGDLDESLLGSNRQVVFRAKK